MKRSFVKGISAAILSVLIAGSVIGCGSTTQQKQQGDATPAPTQQAAAKKQEKVTLSLRHIWADQTAKTSAEILKETVDRFMKENPDFTVQIEAVDHDTHRAKLKAEMAGGNPPDLFYTWGYSFSEPFYKAGKLLDISELLNGDAEWKKGFQNGILEAFHYGNGYYGIPQDGFAEGIFYNKDIFKSLGINPPKDFDELKAVVVKVKDSGSVPIALGNKEKWPGTFIHNYFFDRQAGYDLYKKLMNRENGVSWINDDYIKANDKLIELVKLGAFPKGVSAITRNEGRALFYQGKAAMYVDGSWSLTNFASDEAPKGFIDRVGFINFPSFKDGKGDQKSVVAGFTAGFAISSEVNGNKKAGALKLLKYLNDDKHAEDILYRNKGLPSRKVNNVDKQKVTMLMNEVLGVLDGATSQILPYNDTMPPGMAEVYYDVSQALMEAAMQPKDAMKKLEDAAKEYIQKK